MYCAALTLCNCRISLQNQSLYIFILRKKQKNSEGGIDEYIHRKRTGTSLICLTSYHRPPGIWVCEWLGVHAAVHVCVCTSVYSFSTARRSGSSLPLNRWGAVLWALNSQHSGHMVRLSATLCLWVCVESGRRQDVNICQKQTGSWLSGGL